MFYEPDKNEHGLSRPPFKSCVVPRAIGWISSLSPDGTPNLAPYSQFTNLTFDPPYVALSVNQNVLGLRKDTTNNIEQTGEFVYNMVTYELKDAMNISAVGFEPGVDEFEEAGLEKAPSRIVKPWRVAASPVQLECVYHSTLHLRGNGRCGSTDVIIGRVVGVHIKDEFILPDGKIDILSIKPLARLGYSDYTVVDNIFEIPSITRPGDPYAPSLGLEGAAGTMPK